MKRSWTAFTGIKPKVDDRILPDGNATVAQNITTERGGLRSIEGVSTIMALTKIGVKTIYRFGQALDSELLHWFHWATDVDVAKGAIADDTSERTYWTGDGVPKYTTNALGTTGTNLPSASRPLGVSGPVTAPFAAASGDPPDGAGNETRVYVYTFVTDDSQESAPSPPATAAIAVGQAVEISAMETVSANASVLATKRIYRAQRGVYLFVAEVPSTDTTYIDTIESASLGEECQSVGWDVPPATMTALTAGPNGMMAGVDGYTVQFCEPFRPHAWPAGYSQTLDYPCVGLGQYAQSFVALTNGFPYVLSGVHPANVSMAPAKFYQPCVSKRSIVSTGGDVIWASPDGLVSLGASGEQLLTADIFTPEQWRARSPETITGEWHEGWYVGSYVTTDGIQSFMFQPGAREWIDLPSLAITAMYRDTVGDALFVCINDEIKKFRGGDLLVHNWESQEVITHLADFVVARVTGTYPETFNFYRNDALRLTKIVTSDEPFKLPAGLGRSWRVGISGTGGAIGVVLSTSEEDI